MKNLISIDMSDIVMHASNGYALTMPSMTIRNIPDDVHRAIRARAARHGRSAEAEVREILRQAAEPAGGVRFGDELAALGEAVGGAELDIRRSTRPMRTADLS